MMSIDARMTFDSFVVGPGNRLASAAARRAADSPAASYNPLFLYSPSGLGKSHILHAMAHHSERLNPDSKVLYQTLEGYLDELADAIQRGTQEVLKDRYRDLDILLLDDVQFLTGQAEAQELLLRTLDSLNLSGSQIVLASDRPPAEIDGLDARLLSRFSGGLMVDIAPPELETRVAIVRKKCAGRNVELADGVSEQIARLPFRNVRELMGGLNRILAAQELEGRAISPEDVEKLVDFPAERPRRARRADRLTSHITSEVFEVPEEPWQRLIREASTEAEAEGFATGRLRRVLEGDMEPTDPQQIVDDFHAVLDELRQIRSDLDVVGNPWPEAARGVLLDPDRVEEARALLASARERVRDFPPFPVDVGLHQLEDRYPQIAVKAAQQLIGEESPGYNPLFVWSPDGHGARMLLEATGASCLAERPTARVAFISAKEFAEEFIDALSDGVAGAWRERWWTVELLLVHDCQELSNTERAQDEFFHLFEAVKRRGARVILGSDRSPTYIENIDDRLRSRFEGGLVVKADVAGVPPTPLEELLRQRQKAEPETLATDMDALDKGGEVGPDLQLRREEADTSTPESADPEFDRALGALDGGSEEAAWSVPVKGAQGPEALTTLKVRPEDFPTLISEREKERTRAGVELDPERVDPAAAQTDSSEPIKSSGEAAAATESAVDGPPSEATVSPGVQPVDASSGAPSHASASDLQEEPPVASTEPAEPAAVEEQPALDDGAADDAQAVPAPGPWIAEPLPAVLENELDHVIDSVFAAHMTNGAPPAPAAESELEPEPPAEHRADLVPATAASSAEPSIEPAPAPAPTPDFAFEPGSETGVATRTRTRLTHQTETVEATDPMTTAAPEIDAAQESTPAVAENTQGPNTWWPSREKTVWDWPSLEARMVVED